VGTEIADVLAVKTEEAPAEQAAVEPVEIVGIAAEPAAAPEEAPAVKPTEMPPVIDAAPSTTSKHKPQKMLNPAGMWPFPTGARPK
jgi:hypothetical protein